MTRARELAELAAAYDSGGLSNMKNRIINGNMVIDQRNAGASVTPTTDGTYTLDRWSARLGQASKYSVQQNAGSVTPPAGFINYLGVTSLSSYSLAASDYFAIQQAIEGLNLSDLGWGTSNAQTITLSFWVRSSLTGTFGGCVQNRLSNRSYPFSYTINSANTWEQKTVTVAGDTTGTWDTNTNGGIYLFFALGMGSNRSGTANAWNGGNFLGVSGATSVVGTNGATFYITGVQLEKGSTATSFDYRPYGTELALCQRYFYNLEDTGAAGIGQGYVIKDSDPNRRFQIFHKPQMRAAPTISVTWSTGTPGTANNTKDGVYIYVTGLAISTEATFAAFSASAEL